MPQQEMGDVLGRFYLAVEQANDHIVMTNPQGVIVYANGAAEHTTGYSRTEMIGNTPALWGRQMEPAFYKQLWHTISVEKRSFVGEVRNMRKGGILYDAEIRLSPILDKDGSVLFYVGIERDVTKLKDLDRVKTEFISLASHNLKGPASSVKWYAEMLLTGDAGDLPPKAIEYAQEIHDAGDRMDELVHSLLSISRIDLGTVKYEHDVCNFSKLVDEVIEQCTGAHSHTTQISVSIEDGLNPVFVDSDLLREVVYNLVRNAVKYSNPNNPVLVSVFHKDAGNEVYGRFFSEDRAVLVVKDGGIGIPQEEQKNIFEQFFRASNAQALHPHGAGLGLYLVFRIVKKMNGDIWFSSHEGKGTEFYLALPYGNAEKQDTLSA